MKYDYRKEARKIGLSENLALKYFDKMANEFSHAVDMACDTLMQLGVEKAEEIKRRTIVNHA